MVLTGGTFGVLHTRAHSARRLLLLLLLLLFLAF
jgi:hypothetical protein